MPIIELDNADTLLCPECGNDNLHHEKVNIHNRKNEDEEGITISVNRQEVSITPNKDDFLGRRNDLTITFTCEHCPATPTLTLKQHKGYSLLTWI
jgi:predicted nucleic-acid-binding Zn-ribbon protein